MKSFFEENKKLVFIFGGILGLFILIIIIMAISKAITGTKISVEKFEKLVYDQGIIYFKDNEDKLPLTEGGEVTVTVDKLSEEKYIKPLEKLLDVKCDGGLTAKKNGEFYFYSVSIDCGSTYKTKKLVDVLTDKANVVTDGDGLYQIGEEYRFRGENVKNYISFNGELWQILNIDTKGNIRMIPYKSFSSRVWDNRYNVDVKKNEGINIYSKSRIKEFLDELLKEISDQDKKYMVAHNACISKRDYNDKTISYEKDCDESLENQFMSLPVISDYFLISLDEKCNFTNSVSCENYNYLTNTNSSYWTGNTAFESNKVYSISNSVMTEEKASSRRRILPVVVISGLTNYVSGNGDMDSPYLIRKSK